MACHKTHSSHLPPITNRYSAPASIWMRLERSGKRGMAYRVSPEGRTKFCGYSSLLEHGFSENGPAPQGCVEAVERHRGHQQNPGQADARIPGRPLGGQGKVLEQR